MAVETHSPSEDNPFRRMPFVARSPWTPQKGTKGVALLQAASAAVVYGGFPPTKVAKGLPPENQMEFWQIMGEIGFTRKFGETLIPVLGGLLHECIARHVESAGILPDVEEVIDRKPTFQGWQNSLNELPHSHEWQKLAEKISKRMGDAIRFSMPEGAVFLPEFRIMINPSQKAMIEKLMKNGHSAPAIKTMVSYSDKSLDSTLGRITIERAQVSELSEKDLVYHTARIDSVVMYVNPRQETSSQERQELEEVIEHIKLNKGNYLGKELDPEKMKRFAAAVSKREIIFDIHEYKFGLTDEVNSYNDLDRYKHALATARALYCWLSPYCTQEEFKKVLSNTQFYYLYADASVVQPTRENAIPSVENLRNKVRLQPESDPVFSAEILDSKLVAESFQHGYVNPNAIREDIPF